MDFSYALMPTCQTGGAFLSPKEREMNLRYFSAFLVDILLMPDRDFSDLSWFKIRFCVVCYNDETPDPDASGL